MSINDMPLVSVVIPLYNRERTIKRAMDSVLQQSLSDFEIIVIDDCSTDNSCRVVEQYTDCRIKLIKNEKNYGANYCRNIGIRESRGKYIAFQDSDDEWTNNKLEFQIKYMLERGIKASFCPYILVDDQKIIPDNYEELADNNLVRETLKKYNVVGTPTLMIEKQIIKSVGLFDENIPRLQDYEFAIRIVKQYDMCCCPFIALKVYTDEVRISSDRARLDMAIGVLLRKHFDFIDLDNFFATRYFLLNEGSSFSESVFADLISNKALNAFTIRYLKRELELQTERRKTILDINIRRLKSEKFLIYGAGRFAKELYNELKEHNKKPRCFVITKRRENEDYRIDDIEVLNVDDVIDKSMTVIVAVAPITQNEILKLLKQMGFSDVLTV